jgi:hypothetical protein
MTRLEFSNRLCILRSIDEDELAAAGIKMTNKDWFYFCCDPFRAFLRMDDATAEKLWRIVDRRALPVEIDWSSAAEAGKALDAGLLPPGYALNDDGVLVIPDQSFPDRYRGNEIILARFGEIVTASGKVIKTRGENPALIAARAL